MRIRKRFLLSSLSSLPLSDPQLNRSPPLQLLAVQQQPPPPQQIGESNAPSQPSDSFPNQPSGGNLLLIRNAKPSWVSSSTPKDVEGEVVEEEGEKSNDTKKENISGSGLLQETGSSYQEVIGRWCEGDKVLVPLPPKKRRGSFGDNETEKEKKKKKTKGKMKSKTNKKCVQLLSKNGDDEETNEGNSDDDGVMKKRKAVKRGNVIMEGSRCSRVNGRGWRCCQQTLVGYSLCEHHLGKGRLRSIASVRNHAMATTTPIAPKEDESSQLSNFAEGRLGRKMVEEEDEDEDNDFGEGKPLMMRRKRMKIGMVKARSMSSLLGQTNNIAVVVGNDNDKKISSTIM